MKLIWEDGREEEIKASFSLIPSGAAIIGPAGIVMRVSRSKTARTADGKKLGKLRGIEL